MSDPQDFQKIFLFFDINGEGIINYEDFINKIFPESDSQNSQNNQNNQNSQNNNNLNRNKNMIKNNSPKIVNYSNTNYFSSYNNKKENSIFKNIFNNKKNVAPYKKPFFDKILNKLLNNDIGPSLALLILQQGFIIGDNNFMNQITIEEFIKIIKNNNIDLSISDIQMLFHSYELNSDGFFYYEEMFNDLLNIYWNNIRQKIAQRKSEEIINSLKEEGGLQINLLENIVYVEKNYENFFWNKLNLYDANEYYKELMKKYIGLKRVLNCPTRDTFLTLDDLEEIMKYISFGIKNNDDFNKTNNYKFSIWICLYLLSNFFILNDLSIFYL
jgi:Ca2+-binding EF-hand superfamily protein